MQVIAFLLQIQQIVLLKQVLYQKRGYLLIVLKNFFYFGGTSGGYSYRKSEEILTFSVKCSFLKVKKYSVEL